MRKPVPVIFSPGALRQIAAVGRWWGENRGISGIIGEQLAWISSHLELNPYMGEAVPDARRKGLRRFYLKRINYHVYYQVDEEREDIVIVRLWHARRRPPRL